MGRRKLQDGILQHMGREKGAQEAAGQRPAAHVPIKMGRRNLQDPLQDTVLQQMCAEKWGAGKRRTFRRTVQDAVLQRMSAEKWAAGRRRTPHPIWGYKNIKAGGVGVGVSGRMGVQHCIQARIANGVAEILHGWKAGRHT